MTPNSCTFLYYTGIRNYIMIYISMMNIKQYIKFKAVPMFAQFKCKIFLVDVPVWSKLETGRIPQPNEMFQIIENHMRLYTNPGQ